MRNIELKARYADLAAARRIAEALGSRPHTVERQRDTYFGCRSGRLKLRERWPDHGPASAELIGYHRDDAARPRASDYSVVSVQHGDALRTLLATALGATVTVDKRRVVYLHENVRIHIDDVAGLGTFIEFEAVLDDSCTAVEAHARLRRLMDSFGIRDADIVAVSYADLLQSAG